MFKIKTLEEMYSFLWNFAYYRAEEGVIDTYQMDYTDYGLNTSDEILNVLKKYLIISTIQENNSKNIYKKINDDSKKMFPGTKDSFYIDTDEVLSEIFNIPLNIDLELDDLDLKDSLVCTILAIILFNDVISDNCKAFNKFLKYLKDSIDYKDEISENEFYEELEEIKNYSKELFPKEVKFK